MPKISVLMPIYKTENKCLQEAITSVLNQTFTDFEFLILDDCPEDNREKIVKSFKDKRIKYYKNHKNLGITPSRNKLIDLATGDYLSVMDHDDIAMPERFEKQVEVLEAHKDIGVVGCWIERFPKTKIAKYPQYNREIEAYLMQGCAIAHTASMIRKSVLKEVKYEQEFSPSEDYRLWCRLIGKTKFYNIPQVLMKYRWYDGNTSRKQAVRMSKMTAKIRQYVRQEHEDIWKNVCENAPYLVRMRLFGVIPCGKFIQYGNTRKGLLKYLFFIKLKFRLAKNS